MSSQISLSACSIEARVDFTDRRVGELLLPVYGAMMVPGDRPALTFDVSLSSDDGGLYRIRRQGSPEITGDSLGEFLFYLDKDLTIEIQKLRRDLYFVHAAVMCTDGQACLISAPSGHGKSTLAWALSQHGLQYLSDELAPIFVGARRVVPYPRALNMKAKPPAPYFTDDFSLITDRSLFLGPDRLQGGVINRGDIPIKAIFFLSKEQPTRSRRAAPDELTKAEACARLYANALNQLAHPTHGLDAARAIVEQVTCYRLVSTDLETMCGDVLSIMRS